VLLYNTKSKAKDEADRVCKKLAGLGFKNRGLKYRPELYFLRKVSAPAMLIEVCFVDDKDDVKIYNKNKSKIAKKIAEAIVNKTINIKQAEFKVRVKTDLNIRSGAGTDYPVVGVIKDNGTYTIIDTSGNWGKLKSGAGWINISDKYVTRM
jgi:uncharacterized protein YgiM (DUF1202 family)